MVGLDVKQNIEREIMLYNMPKSDIWADLPQKGMNKCNKVLRESWTRGGGNKLLILMQVYINCGQFMTWLPWINKTIRHKLLMVARGCLSGNDRSTLWG